MTLSIKLDEQLEIVLRDAARRRGVEPPEYARQVLEQNLLHAAAGDGNRATLELLAAWRRQDAAGDAADDGQRELDELKRALNENRAFGRKPFP